jgi:hypothetical protein
MPRLLEHRAQHTQVHRLSRHLLEPAQDILVLGICLALCGPTVGSLGAPPERAAEP